MKVSLITIHGNGNYGSVLQTLATQMQFERHGMQVEVVDYRPERYSIKGLLKRLKRKNRRFKNPALFRAAQCVMLPSYVKRRAVFDRFLKKYIRLSPQSYADVQSLKVGAIQADAYCTGSDQIWNSLWNEGIDASYFLEWTQEKAFCFSYASSIGRMALDEAESREMAALLKKYRYLSVREDSAVRILNGLGFERVEHVLDPTLLMTREEWAPYVSDRYREKRFVATYNLHHDPRVDELAARIAEREHCDVYNITYNWHDCIRHGKTLWCPPVEEYLGLIRDARYVVADSFHATAFSLIFHTPFFAVAPEKAGSRLVSLLSAVGMKERLCAGMPEQGIMDQVIDFSQADAALERMRGTSEAYIREVARAIAGNR